MSHSIEVLAKMNDDFRKGYDIFNEDLTERDKNGFFVYSESVKELDYAKFMTVHSGVTIYADFTSTHELTNERNKGRFFEERIMSSVNWEINYYDVNYRNPSLDPCNPLITRRVLTVMLGHNCLNNFTKFLP